MQQNLTCKTSSRQTLRHLLTRLTRHSPQTAMIQQENEIDAAVELKCKNPRALSETFNSAGTIRKDLANPSRTDRELLHR